MVPVNEIPLYFCNNKINTYYTKSYEINETVTIIKAYIQAFIQTNIKYIFINIIA